ncbi:Nmd4p NDAI_0J02000 [Naumovozyma dairenensis CBS 421]|uniref:PIN domain-containing protein n=1 Tax=Naumovozyma dairenensis (strain ATCC 10597 / BCRC 20456 / CBS 421 / NBRC 0211 / NRRL Y-12639) TaxID=1071378 RepID=G0WH14_NAUDC|nr:hypothetical protein NDAI_0J02000 [Naumovozyma dairenensis CBS 421]CCD27092.1 hypothetical protein NDAI_0J02000 [Naumovozyma dairenensis CBS 421]
MPQYNFILEASAFNRGLGNIKRWITQNTDNGNTTNTSMNEDLETINLNFYIPTYTLKELDFLQYHDKSFNARESLKFIDNYANPTHSNGNKNESNVQLIIEFPDILDLVPWSDILQSTDGSNQSIDQLNKLPRRLKNFLKSCIYKLHDDDVKWILITEDEKIRKISTLCNIPWCSIVDADSLLSKEFNYKSFQETESFYNSILKNGGVKQINSNGDQIIKTNFENTVYAKRGAGELWSP